MCHCGDDHALLTCPVCLQVLKALAATHNLEIQRKFVQMRVVDFLVRELSLEYEVTITPSSMGTEYDSPHPTKQKSKIHGK